MSAASSKVRLAVFDWNGTLLDDVQPWLAGCNAALSVFSRAPMTLDQWRECYTCPIIHSYEKAGISVDEYLEKFDEANLAFYSEYQKQIASGFKLRIGASDVLRALGAQGYVCTILSNHRHDLLEKEVEDSGLGGFFSHICGNLSDNDIAHKMTKQERLGAYIDKVGADVDQSFVIGDSHEEPFIARHLGLKGVSIEGGYVSSGRLRDCAPDALIAELDALPSALEKFSFM